MESSKSRTVAIRTLKQYGGVENFHNIPGSVFNPLPGYIKRALLDEVWSYLVKLRAGFVCEISGKSDNLNSHHIIGKDRLRIRWELDNGICINQGIHKFNAHSDVYAKRLDFETKVKALRGEDIYDRLNFLRNTGSTPRINHVFYYFVELQKHRLTLIK